MAIDPKAEHNLVLKVMRLTKPTFGPEWAFPFTRSPEVPEDSRSLDNWLNLDACSPGQCLILPQSFGNIYLGETFMCYVCLHNDSTDICRNVSVTCDLQTATQRLQLLLPAVTDGTVGRQSEDKICPNLSPSNSIDYVLSHEVKELGTHILVCEVQYVAPERGKLNFRKYFKFQVTKPLDVKTKLHSSKSDETLLEAQVQNITSEPLCLEKVSLEPTPTFRVTALNQCLEASAASTDVDAGRSCNSHSVFGKINFLQPLDSRQYLFSLTPKSGDLKSGSYRQGKGLANAIGKLDIVWRTNMGDRGRLQTSQLQRDAPLVGDVRVNVIAMPNAVTVGDGFRITCFLANNSDRTMDLDLHLENVGKPKMLWSGATFKKLGLIEPAGSMELSLELIPNCTGLQNVSGVRLKDTLLQRTYAFDDLCCVLVTADHSLLSVLSQTSPS